MARTVLTSTTHDGIYITVADKQIKIDDNDIRKVIDGIMHKNTVTAGSTTLHIPPEEAQEVIKELLFRLDQSGIEN